ncbi:MAG: hypothetical protein IOD12_07895 [Silvanigrellales bacterium]|nr:hypothetical protein [Silvanigrellales bacterium]
MFSSFQSAEGHPVFLGVPLLLAASVLSVPSAFAEEYKTLSFLKFDTAASSPASSISGVVVLRNDTRLPLTLVPAAFRVDGALFQMDTPQGPLKPGESVEIRFRGQISRAGKWAIEIPVDAFVPNSRAPLARQLVDLYFFAAPDASRSLVARRSSYEELFLKMGARDIPGQGRVFDSVEDKGQFPKGDDYRNNKQPPMSSWPQKPDRTPSRRIPPGTGAGGNGFLPEASHDEPFSTMLERWFNNFPERFLNPDERNKALEAPEAFGTVQAKGVWSYRGVDSALHPGWGWRVRAWVNSGGSWSKVAEDWVEWDGRWTLTFNQPAGAQVQFQYIAYNRYFTPQNNDGDTYRWVGPVRGALPATHAEGSWFADTSMGNVRGLGELYKDAYTLWSGLYWQGNINPLRNDSIKVIFPNLTYKCGGDTVWSCANTGGNIWLIPSHGINGQTIIHELGHQLNYEYWDNARPDNAGGSHSLDQCYTAGLALLEGFANYIVGWTKTNRDTNANMVRNLEDPSAIGACTTTNLNEAYVGATFWDLHDKVADGKDSIWFVNRGAVPALYLNAGMKQKMSDFRETYRNAANTEHRSIVDSIFEQNHTK